MPKKLKPLISDKDLEQIGNIKVTYKRKKRLVGELLLELTEKVRELEKNQCEPHTKCLFKAWDYMDKEYIEGIDYDGILDS